MCKAYRITEHPQRPTDAYARHTKPGELDLPGPLKDVKPEIDTVEVSCNDKKMEAVEPGSLKTPLPRHSP